MRGIINAGITKIVIEPDELGFNAKDERWKEHTMRSMIMCIEARIKVIYYGDNDE
jgi:hypothetical protein